MSDSAQDHYKMKNQLLLETEVVKYLLVGNASGEHSRNHCHLEDFFLQIKGNCSMWLLALAHST